MIISMCVCVVYVSMGLVEYIEEVARGAVVFIDNCVNEWHRNWSSRIE